MKSEYLSGTIPNITEQDVMDLARTVWGEARGEGPDGKLAVAHVILNRQKSGRWYGGQTVSATCRKPYQFSCWNMNDPNRSVMLSATLDDQSFRECMYFALGALLGHLPDNTSGATHYHNWHMDEFPAWADPEKSIGRIGNHEFYVGVN